MLKRLRFLYRYLFASYRRHKWLNAQTMLVVVTSTIFLSSLYMTAPFSDREPAHRVSNVVAAVDAVATENPYPYPSPENQTVDGTPLPPDFYRNADQSIGITLAATVLVMIVVFGALMYIPRHEDEG